MYQKYYDILELNPGCSLNELKLAFRTKAKQFHPDINHSPDAHSKFININEAYIMLNKILFQQEKSDLEERKKEWYRQEREKAFYRAMYYAKMKYEEYLNSPIYKASRILNPIFKTIVISFGIFIFLSPIIFITYRKINNYYVRPENYVALLVLMTLLFFTLKVGIKEIRKYT